MAAAINLPLNTDKMVFAVDIISHVILTSRPDFQEKISSVRNRVKDISATKYFCSNVKKVINKLLMTNDAEVRQTFSKMTRRMDDLSISVFTEYSESSKAHHLEQSFNPMNFLKYCVLIADMSVHFILWGVDDAPEVAVDIIKDSFPNHIPARDLWESLKSAAKEYLLNHGEIIEATSSEASDNTDEDYGTGSDSNRDSDYGSASGGNASTSDELPND